MQGGSFRLLNLMLLWVWLFPLSCLSSQPRRVLEETITEYHNAIRWGRFVPAQQYVDPQKLQTFYRWMEAWERTVEIQEWKLKGIVFKGDDQAEVIIERTGYRKDELKERRFILHQIWRRVGERWYLKEGF